MARRRISDLGQNGTDFTRFCLFWLVSAGCMEYDGDKRTSLRDGARNCLGSIGKERAVYG